MREIIHPIGGFEVAVLSWVKQANAAAVSFSMEGWAWWMVFAVDLAIDNTGGAVAAQAAINGTFSNGNTFRAISGVAAGIGASQASVFSLGVTGYTTGAGNPNVVPLPFAINPNGTTLVVGYLGGDAGTRVDKGTLCVYGITKGTPRKQ